MVLRQEREQQYRCNGTGQTSQSHVFRPSSSFTHLPHSLLALLAVALLPSLTASSPFAIAHVQAVAVEPYFTRPREQQAHQLTFQAPHEAIHEPHEPSASSQSFSLTRAIHMGSSDRYPGLKAQHDFEPGSYSTLLIDEDITAQSINTDSIQQQPRTYGFDEVMHVKSVKQRIWKPSHPAGSEVYEAARRSKLKRNDAHIQQLASQLTWQEVDVDAPDVSDVETLATLAKISSNAYSTPASGWYDVSNHTLSDGRKYNLSTSFGWKEDGLRGHIFSSGPKNESIIVSLKGTSSFVGGGETGRNDKLNDNLLFSCCCARIDWTWAPVCDCYAGRGADPPSNDTTAALPSATSSFEDQVYVQRCNLTCLEDALIEKSVYYPLATDLFNNITTMYPQSRIWLTGHSLGGSLAALLGTTFGVPTVTFEAPGDLLPARRLHLPLPPGTNWDDKRPDFGITHVYTNSDPIPQGVCTGAFSTCNLVGFALEAKCHTGQTIVYDAVGKLGWSVDIRTHRIGTVIDNLLIPDWDKKMESDSAVVAAVHPIRPSLISGREQNWFKLWGWPWPRRGDKRRDGDDNSPDDHAPGGSSSSAPDATSSFSTSAAPKPTQTRRSHVPKAHVDSECQDCFKWEFFDDFAAGT